MWGVRPARHRRRLAPALRRPHRSPAWQAIRDSWTLSANNDAILPAIHHYADFDPGNALAAAAAAFRGSPYSQSTTPGAPVIGDAMYGSGRLSLAVEPFTTRPAGACASASQVLQVDRRSPRYEIDFLQYSRHTPYPGFSGAHQVTVELDGKAVWTRDANAFYPFWENGSGLHRPALRRAVTG